MIAAQVPAGPWDTNVRRLSDGSICVAHIVAEDGSAVAQLANYGEEQTLANARLGAAAPVLYAALEEARAVIADEREAMVECATMPPEHDLATLDPMTKPYVEEYDRVLAKIDSALAKVGGKQ